MLTLMSGFIIVLLVDHMYAKFRKNPFAAWG